MMNNITLGQYLPYNSPIHRLDPRTKIILLVLLITAVFCAGTLWSFIPTCIMLAGLITAAKIPAKIMLRSLKPLRFILILTFLLNLFFSAGEIELFHWHFITITQEALLRSILYSVRLILLIMCSSILTFTTAPIPLTDGLESLLSPLKKIHFPAHEMAMMMTIALRFIPTLMDEADKIMKAQASRCADFESGNLVKRAKAMVPLLVPLFVSAFRRAGDLATAMESRCYHGGEGRTKLHVLKMHRMDWMILLSGLVLIAVTVLISGR